MPDYTFSDVKVSVPEGRVVVDMTGKPSCWRCNGTRQIQVSRWVEFPHWSESWAETCPECDGTELRVERAR